MPENRRSSQGRGAMRTPCTLPLDSPLYWGRDYDPSNSEQWSTLKFSPPNRFQAVTKELSKLSYQINPLDI